MTLSRFKAFPDLPSIKLLIVLFVLAIALASAIPSYISGLWPWQQFPKVEQLQQLKAVQKNGLSLTGWHTIEQRMVEIGGHKWSAQAMVPEAEVPEAEVPEASLQTAFWLLLRPQSWERDMPQIDWTDINGIRQWQSDSERTLRFAAGGETKHGETKHTVTARFFRGWTNRRTDAVLQWYAWSSGGHPAPSRWFWLDQWQQLHKRRRLAWVAVSIQMPIKPLGEISAAESDLRALGELVQSTLVREVLQ